MLHLPRLVVSGLSGGSGKTIVSLGLSRLLARSGLPVSPFKKGPDYIDAAWLALAAGTPCANLDTFLMDEETVRGLFAHRATPDGVSVIEGNRGLFDGGDARGTFSTAELAKLLRAPVVLVLDATKMTRTAAALLHGCATFDPKLRPAGVICNQTAGERHRAVLREAIEANTDVPVLGMLPKLSRNPIPERHMGLWSDQEMDGAAVLDPLADIIAEHCDVSALTRLARSAGGLAEPTRPLFPEAEPGEQVTIGVVRDAALWFYYPENIEALERAGARIEFLSVLTPDFWPELDGLYLGGGFPETQAAAIAARADVRERVRSLSASGLPIYAECGGFMYLARALEYEGRRYPMAGALPAETRVCTRPKGLGYVEAEVLCETPYHPRGARLRAHEFHYSHCHAPIEEASLCLRLSRGTGMDQGRDGLFVGNTFAAYSHIHALGTPHWAPRFVAAARAHRRARTGAAAG
ncbi:Cobyrinic acid A,C-diamide synthase [Desulfovibrio sp. X2]|uniref:cobyrinate a,c-diamide synthase n=1 Tax=Desulfovibrio sp. X2 TaxID=941449 RepID=UPI000358AB7C|nr:cobyrinate a,c-diamide synthase [Desulfovibrio sp. X2]EPR37658.1 Cobyrinic acid A,C-diamide synthase [Desulfovibrio sp. X2]